ncbi:hypothetical protein ACFW2V_13665 [Streptomyces sp. NPDC058947]|uniref:hypothetical protein n=1 Tax=Streptomyces sp. NPDC058947 TaxID=3346675 RepID=UPI00369CE7A2
MNEEHYWVQIDGGLEYTTNDSGRLFAMLFGVMIGLGEPNLSAHRWTTNVVDRVVKEQVDHVETLKDGRVLRLSVVQPGEGDE